MHGHHEMRPVSSPRGSSWRAVSHVAKQAVQADLVARRQGVEAVAVGVSHGRDGATTVQGAGDEQAAPPDASQGVCLAQGGGDGLDDLEGEGWGDDHGCLALADVEGALVARPWPHAPPPLVPVLRDQRLQWGRELGFRASMAWIRPRIRPMHGCCMLLLRRLPRWHQSTQHAQHDTSLTGLLLAGIRVLGCVLSHQHEQVSLLAAAGGWGGVGLGGELGWEARHNQDGGGRVRDVAVLAVAPVWQLLGLQAARPGPDGVGWGGGGGLGQEGSGGGQGLARLSGRR